MTIVSKLTLTKLYLNQHLSAKEISLILNLSEHKIRYALAKYQVPMRSRSEANYHRYNPLGEPFKIKNNLTKEERDLFYLSLGLYWGEGGKTNYQCARLTNSDPFVIKTFCTFLTDICQIKHEKLRFYLQTFKDNDIAIAKNHWSKILDIPTTKINTCNPIPSQGKGNYKHISKYGVMTIGVYNIHFRAWMMEQLYKLGYNPD